MPAAIGDSRAGRGFAVMATGFEGHIRSAAACRRSGFFQRHRFGMWPSAWLSPAAAHNPAFIDDHTAYSRIGRNLSRATLRQRKGVAHMTDIGISRRRRLGQVRAR